MNFHFLYRAYHYKLRSREYSRFGLTLVKLHISRCKILNGDSSLHSEGNARCVMFLTDMPLHVSQSLPCVNTGDCSPGQHWLQFTFHNPSQLYTMLIYDYLLLDRVIKSQHCCGSVQDYIELGNTIVLIMLLFVTNMT